MNELPLNEENFEKALKELKKISKSQRSHGLFGRQPEVLVSVPALTAEEWKVIEKITKSN
ncbi:hypothetical protein AAC861_002808 [Vibrio cholerae]|nr:hypothetical protein [Vibrio cholerae]